MKLTYEELVAEQEKWYPIICWLHRNRVPSAAKKTSLILSTIVEWAGWDDEEFFQTVTAKFRLRRIIRQAMT